MSRRTLSVLAAAGAATLAVAAPAAADHRGGPDRGGPDRGGADRGAEVHVVDLDALNDSGVDGRAVLVQRGDDLRVTITARGLKPGEVHFQHIHGLAGDEQAVCPPADAADNLAGLPEEADNPNQLISLEEGVPFYGGVLQPLTPYPTANRAGVVTYTETFEVSGDLADLSDEVIVLHGADVDGTYVGLLPVACGPIG